MASSDNRAKFWHASLRFFSHLETDAGSALRERFARNLRQLRMQKGLTQEQLASAAGIGRPFVNQLERGHFSATLETIASLAFALETTPEALILA